MVNTSMENDIILNIVDDELVEEGLGQMVQLGVLASVLGFAGIVDAQDFKSNISKQFGQRDDKKSLTIQKSDLREIIEKSKPKDANQKIGQWDKDKAINIVARTLWMEARGEGNIGLNMVMTVIWNRANGMPEHLVEKCLERKQFSCWNDISNKTPSTYSITFPKSALKGAESSTWNKCQSLAKSAIEGNFTPVNKEWNAYYNPDKCDPSWGSQLKGSQMVGHHKVGNLKEWKVKANRLAKSNVPQSNKVYVVKKGDSLWGIAKTYKTTVDKLKSMNGLKSNTIKFGQVLKIA